MPEGEKRKGRGSLGEPQRAKRPNKEVKVGVLEPKPRFSLEFSRKLHRAQGGFDRGRVRVPKKKKVGQLQGEGGGRGGMQ